MYVDRGGSGDPVLLLLHGLGATGTVWLELAELLPRHWPGSWVIPDLPGHGRSDPLPRYTFGALAAAVAEVVEPGRRVAVLGHSLGGAVGLALASSSGDQRTLIPRPHTARTGTPNHPLASARPTTPPSE